MHTAHVRMENVTWANYGTNARGVGMNHQEQMMGYKIDAVRDGYNIQVVYQISVEFLVGQSCLSS